MGRFPWSVAFIASALLALAAVPVWVEREVAADETRIDRIEVVRSTAAELEATHTRQMTRFQEYLLTGSLLARGRYNVLDARVDSLVVVLDAQLRQAGVDEPAQLALASEVRNLSNVWRLEHLWVLSSPDSIPVFVDYLSADLDRYEGLLRVSAELRGLLRAESEAAQLAMQDTRETQSLLTTLLVIIALAATLAVGRLARKLNAAADEARRRREDALRARREIDAILQATAEGVLGVDLSGRVIRLNQAGSRLLGFTEEDARGRRFHRVLHAGHPVAEETGELPESRAMRRALLSGEAVDAVDGQIHPRRGGVVEVRWSLRPLVDGTEVRGAVITLTDMREVREVETALRKAIRARQETMAVVGHDLRSPLSSIAAAAELLRDVPLPADRRELQLDSILSATDRMTRLIGDLMDLTRIDSGRLRVSRREADLGALLERALRLAQPNAARDGVEVIRGWDPDLPPLELDDHRILQVLSNLISNALRYTGRGGRVEVGARVGDREVEVWVQDDGSGIDPEDLPYLWDPFWQPERDRQARREGAGLGLAIVKGIVQAHGGRVRVESTPGQGSRFIFTLPLSAEPATPRGGPPGSS